MTVQIDPPHLNAHYLVEKGWEVTPNLKQLVSIHDHLPLLIGHTLDVLEKCYNTVKGKEVRSFEELKWLVLISHPKKCFQIDDQP